MSPGPRPAFTVPIRSRRWGQCAFPPIQCRCRMRCASPGEPVAIRHPAAPWMRPQPPGRMTTDEPLEVRAAVAVPVVRLVGELDITQAGLVRRQLLSYSRATDVALVFVDMSQVSFIDCAGLEPLLSANRWLLRRNRRLVLRPVSTQVDFLLTSLRRAGSDHVIEHATGSGSAPRADHSTEVADDSDLGHLMDQVGALAVRLRQATEGQPLIEQATGLLMAVHNSSAAEAVELLTRVSHQHNLAVVDLAGGLAGLAAARGGRATLNLSPEMKAAVRGVLAHPGPAAPAAHPGSA